MCVFSQLRNRGMLLVKQRSIVLGADVNSADRYFPVNQLFQPLCVVCVIVTDKHAVQMINPFGIKGRQQNRF